VAADSSAFVVPASQRLRSFWIRRSRLPDVQRANHHAWFCACSSFFCSRITMRSALYFPQLCFSHICLPHVRPICNFAVQLSLCQYVDLSISAYLWTKLGSHMCNVLGLCLRFLDSCSKNLRRVCFYCANKRWSILCCIKHLFAFHTDFSCIFQPMTSCAVFSSPAFPRSAFLCHIFHSRVFQPCSFVPYFPFLHFPALHFSLCRIFMSRIFSRPDDVHSRSYCVAVQLAKTWSSVSAWKIYYPVNLYSI